MFWDDKDRTKNKSQASEVKLNSLFETSNKTFFNKYVN